VTVVPTNHEEILGMAQARRDRARRREEDRHLRAATASGARHPTVDDLLRGHPLQGGELARDVREFVAVAVDGLVDPASVESLKRLGNAARQAGPGGSADGAAILAAIQACCFSPEADPNGTIRLRCVIYAALLGDVDAAHAVAAEAALVAYTQDWHLEGDGSDLVWQAAAWSAFAAGRVGPFRRLPYTISEMPSVRDRVDAFAEEFRLRVGRLFVEVS
jgi:hypothetical protein